MIRLLSQKDNSIPAKDMKDGDVGVITEWNGNHYYTGRVVQRYQNCLITLGSASGNCWPEIDAGLNDRCRVRLLEDGETLVFTKKGE